MENRPAPAVYRSAPQRPRLVRELAFDRLPPAVRDRLTRGIVDGALPDPLLAARSSAALHALRGLVATASAAGLAGVSIWLWDLGSLHGKNAVQPPSYGAVYGALFFVAVVAGAAALQLRRFQRGAPFPSGRYLFSMDLVEARGGELRVTALDTLRRVEARARGLALVFEDGHEVAFPLARDEEPEQRAALVTAEVEGMRDLSRPADDEKLSRLDPFHEVRITDGWAAAAEGTAKRRAPLRWAVLGAVIGATPAGYGLWRAHEAVSDDLMFERATSDRIGEARANRLAAYVERGKRHHAEMTKYLLEAADGDRDVLREYAARGGALGQAAEDALFDVAKDDPQELSRFIRRGGLRAAEADEALFALAKRRDGLPEYHAYLEVGTRHVDEVKRELLPEADWKQASRSALVGSLCTFVRRNPGSKHEDEAWKRIHARYGEARAHHRQATKADAAGQRFAEALLAALEERADPRVDLVIAAAPSDEVAKADTVLGAKFGDRYLPGAAHFSPRELDSLRRAVRDAVGGWFGSAFPHGVAEAVAFGQDEGRPRFEVSITPVPTGYSEWRSPIAAEDAPRHVTPLVALEIEVRGTLPAHDGQPEVKIAWKQRLDDESKGKLLARTADGLTRSPREMTDDAYALFLFAVPERIAAGFAERF